MIVAAENAVWFGNEKLKFSFDIAPTLVTYCKQSKKRLKLMLFQKQQT
jgi:hypothetical protein